MAKHLNISLGHPVVIENVTGAAGAIAGGRVARAAPDGYTLGIGNWGTHVINGAVMALPYDPVKDLEPVALIASNPLMRLLDLQLFGKQLPESHSIRFHDSVEGVRWRECNVDTLLRESCLDIRLL